MNISFLCIRIHKKQNWPFHRWIRYGFKSGWTICWVGLIIQFITALGASKGHKMISSLIKTYQDLFPPPSDRDTISLLPCSGEKMCLKSRICEIFYEKYYENFTKNHNHDAYWKGRGRTVGFNQRTAASLIHLPPRNKSHLWTELCALCSCWFLASDFILYGK